VIAFIISKQRKTGFGDCMSQLKFIFLTLRMYSSIPSLQNCLALSLKALEKTIQTSTIGLEERPRKEGMHGFAGMTREALVHSAYMPSKLVRR
tara:strand:- start:16188 stop:16466 length:279 start_codon:yes stop_codon:yes gene_type:complete